MTTGAPDGTITDYSGNYIYENNILQFINQPEGYIEPNSQDGFDYVYQYKDHLGNIRLSFVDWNISGSITLSEITEENNYYPFGLKHQGYNNLISSNANAVAGKFKYNGKELNDELGLNLYDYGARMYDPALGTWTTMDPLAEKYAKWSPYNYVGANPIKRIDPDGRDWNVVINHDQQTVTIQANFNTLNGSKETIQKSADSWSAQSGKFSYVVGKGDEAVSYSVNFEVTAQNPEGGADNRISVLPDDAKTFTSRTRTNESGDEVTAEGLSDGTNIAVKESNKENSQITSHEMGHNLGMGHSSGLMHKEGGKSLSKTSIKETLGHSGVGKGVKGATTNATMQNKTVVGTAPENFQEGKLKKNNDWEKTNF